MASVSEPCWAHPLWSVETWLTSTVHMLQRLQLPHFPVSDGAADGHGQ